MRLLCMDKAPHSVVAHWTISCLSVLSPCLNICAKTSLKMGLMYSTIDSAPRLGTESQATVPHHDGATVNARVWRELTIKR